MTIRWRSTDGTEFDVTEDVALIYTGLKEVADAIRLLATTQEDE